MIHVCKFLGYSPRNIPLCACGFQILAAKYALCIPKSYCYVALAFGGKSCYLRMSIKSHDLISQCELKARESRLVLIQV